MLCIRIVLSQEKFGEIRYNHAIKIDSLNARDLWQPLGLIMKILISVCSFILTAIVFIGRETDALPIGIGTDGEYYYPISSGDVDAMILYIGFWPFTIVSLISIYSLIVRDRVHVLYIAYTIALTWFLFILFLVLLDSSLVDSAKLGDWVPLFGAVVAVIPAIPLLVRKVIPYMLNKLKEIRDRAKEV